MAECAPRALLIDFGGVLTTSVWASFAAFCEREGIDPKTVKDVFRSDEQALADLRELESGRLAQSDFEQRFASRLGVEPEGLTRRLFAEVEPDQTMVATVRSVRAAGVATCLVSNSWGSGLYDELPMAELFDATVISGEVGMHKPRPEIYELSAQRVGHAPSACVFVDDLRENCEGARAVGMTAVLHRHPAGTRTRLDELLGLGLVG
ncbi:MAG: HAD family hydrolase [Solirubrobacterales bacterium]